MTDIVDPATRSRMMAGIRGKNTRPEIILRRALHARGFRYRLHVPSVLGRPDIVLPRYNAVVFVHGCFWHRHEGCRFSSMPATRPEFWRAKFSANVERDRRVRESLLLDGWRLAVIWECALRKPLQLAALAEHLSTWLRSQERETVVGEETLR